MPTIRFTDNLHRHVDCPEEQATGSTVASALADYFSSHPDVKAYVLDDQNQLRQHMVIFINSKAISDRQSLSDPVESDDTIDVMQALSGG